MVESTQHAGLLVMLKFHYGKRGSVNPVISKTMGKVAVISHAYQAQMPQPKSFWLCRIDREISNPERGTGCFIVTPIYPVAIEQIKKLIPGTYDTEVKDKTMVCRPKVNGVWWIMPFSIKKLYIKKDKAKIQYESIIIPLEGVDNIKTILSRSGPV